MGLLSRRRLPDEVRALVPKGQRLRAWASGPPRLDGSPTYVVATDVALYAPGYVPSALGTDAVEWDRFVRAAWDEPILDAVVTNDAGGSTLMRVTLDNPGSLPEVVRERITASIVMSNHIDLVGDLGARLVARRVRGSQEIKWSVVFDSGLDPSDPVLRARADEALTRLRDSAGI